MPIRHIAPRGWTFAACAPFVTVAEHGTVSKAAEILHITQPALSRQISALEEELGFALFLRTGRRLALTARGEQLVGDTRNLLSHAGSLHDRAQALRRGDLKTLKVVGSPLTIEALFPTFLPRFAARVPDIQLSVIEGHAAGQVGMLELGGANLAVSVVNDLQFDKSRIGSHLLPSFHVMAACAPHFSADRGDSVDVRRLMQHPLLALNSTYATRSIFDAACRLADLRPNILVESAAAHGLMDFAEAGQGIAILPSILRTDRHALRVMRVTHRREPLHISLAVLWDKRRTRERHAEAFSRLMTDHIRETFPDGRPAPLAQPPKSRIAATMRRR